MMSNSAPLKDESMLNMVII